MKTILNIITALLLFCISLQASPIKKKPLREAKIFSEYQIDSIVKNEISDLPPSVTNTVIAITHPNSEDSMKVVKIVNGVITVSSVFFPRQGFFIDRYGALLGSIITMIVLGIWRRRELKKMKRKGYLTDDYQI